MTPLAAKYANELNDEYRRMMNEWFFKWHYIGKDGPVEIDGFDGRKIRYGGIGFSGSARDVYWDTIQRYARQKVAKVFEDVEEALPRYDKDTRSRTLDDLFGVVAAFCGSIRRAAIEKDRILRGDGMSFPINQDLGDWVGSRNEDIQTRIAALKRIYCVKTFTIDGVEMAFDDMLTDTLSLIKADGTVDREGVAGRISNGTIYIFDETLPIQEGDHFLRKLPNGLVEDYEVLDPNYLSGIGGIEGHFETKVKRSGKSALPANQAVTNITNNFHGANSRVNIRSVDNSTNVTSTVAVNDIAAFTKEVRRNVKGLPKAQRDLITAELTSLETILQHAQPDQSKIRTALKSIKSIAEQATGSLVASGIVALTSRLLGA